MTVSIGIFAKFIANSQHLALPLKIPLSGWRFCQSVILAMIPVASFVAQATPLSPFTLSQYVLSRSGLAQIALPQSDLQRYQQAFQAADKDKWDFAFTHAQNAENHLPTQILKWKYYQYDDNKADFAEITDFIRTNPHWPNMSALHQSAENAIEATTPHQDLITWFKTHDPHTINGIIHYAKALTKDGREEKAENLVRQAWRNRDMLPGDEKEILRSWKKWITTEDHLARLETLLWRGITGSATRQSRRVAKDYAKLAKARIKLRRRARGVDQAIGQVPAHLKAHPGLAYERLRWRIRKGRYADAVELLNNPQQEKEYANYWWKQRRQVARWALREKQFDLAYKIAKNHSNTSGYAYADAEWLAGWIALQYLHKPIAAVKHFQNMQAKVSFPISLSRAGYWRGRAHEALGAQDKALQSYKDAATFAHRFYGQLAMAKLHKTKLPGHGPTATSAVDDQAQEFELHSKDTDSGATDSGAAGSDIINPGIKNPGTTNPAITDNVLAKAIVLMNQLGEDKIAKSFTKALLQQVEREEEFQFIAALNTSIGRHDLAVYTAREADKKHITLYEYGYPVFPLENKNFLHSPIVQAIIRQESAFDPKVKSSAGALGMMQLMPATAKRQARRLPLHYSKKRLTSDPLYNITIGQSYLSGLIQRFDGFLPMAFAGYNAGPGRVKRWVIQNGDPRVSMEEMIDWIEMIPYEETRNYVQRVSENLLVYKQKLGEPARELSLDILNHALDPTLSN